jgi:dTDP-4-dehydrorhamnose reductase
VLVVGSGGMLGTDLIASTPPGVTTLGLDHAALDVSDRAALRAALDGTAPEVVINAAAYTAVDRAESERDRANQVNGVAPGLLGEECGRLGIRVVHFSTDYVFAGTSREPYAETDDVSPINAYGESKLLGERALLSTRAAALVLRTQWLFGHVGRSFPRTMWERATAGQRTRVVDDQHGRPTYTVDLAVATWQLIALGSLGIVHVTNAGPVATWFELAREVFARAGAESLLSACTSRDYPTPARRPAYSALDTARLESLLPRPMPSWQDGLDRFLGELAAERGQSRSALHTDQNDEGLPER